MRPTCSELVLCSQCSPVRSPRHLSIACLLLLVLWVAPNWMAPLTLVPASLRSLEHEMECGALSLEASYLKCCMHWSIGVSFLCKQFLLVESELEEHRFHVLENLSCPAAFTVYLWHTARFSSLSLSVYIYISRCISRSSISISLSLSLFLSLSLPINCSLL